MKEYTVEYVEHFNKGPVRVRGTVCAENEDDVKKMLSRDTSNLSIDKVEFEGEGDYDIFILGEKDAPDTECDKINPIIEVQEWSKEDIMYYIKDLGYEASEENFDKVMNYNNSEIRQRITYHYDEQIANIRDVIAEALG
jgi:hypothetical protein